MIDKSGWMVSMQFGRQTKLVLMLAALGLLVSCGDKKPAEEKAGQSIVRVNGDEITIHQLNAELQRANVQPAQQELAGKQITKSLVDRQILVQQAITDKLDRNPNVMQAIESAKAQILAQAYIEGKIASIANPTDTEISDYRTKHPEIFANRKVYIMEELSFIVSPENSKDLKSLSDSAKTLEDVTSWLDAHQVKYGRNKSAHAAETVPGELLNKFSKMVVGDLIFINANGRTVVGRLVEVKDVPISEKDSKPLIQRIILSQKRKDVAEAELSRLRTAAKIEYLNKQFDPTTEAAKNAEQPAEAAQSAPTKPVDAVQPVPNNEASDSQDKSLEKGLKGL